MTTPTIQVRVPLAAQTFLDLEAMAELRGLQVGDYVAAYMERCVTRYQAQHAETEPSTDRAKYQTHTRLTTKQVAELAQLTADGWTARELAQRYGCSTSTINNWRKRTGIRVERDDLTHEDRATIRELTAAGWSIARIAAHLGCGRATVSRWRRENP